MQITELAFAPAHTSILDGRYPKLETSTEKQLSVSVVFCKLYIQSTSIQIITNLENFTIDSFLLYYSNSYERNHSTRHSIESIYLNLVLHRARERRKGAFRGAAGRWFALKRVQETILLKEMSALSRTSQSERAYKSRGQSPLSRAPTKIWPSENLFSVSVAGQFDPTHAQF